MPEHFYLPKTRIAFTVIPKTGCTTLKNYLINIEKRAESSNLETESDSYLNMAIHSSTIARDYRVGSLSSPKMKTAFKVLVLRNPYHRALSAWTNKLLYAQGDFSIFELLRNEPFTPVEVSSVEQLNRAFELFLERLEQDRKFLESDRHWRPQSWFVSDPSKYSAVLETSSMAQLQQVLAARSEYADLVVNRPVPRFNASRTEMLSLLGTERAWQLVERIYASDFELLARSGLAKPEKPAISKLDPALQAELLAREKPEILLTRAESEQNFYRNELETIKASRSWRWTKWLRVLSSPFLR